MRAGNFLARESHNRTKPLFFHEHRNDNVRIVQRKSAVKAGGYTAGELNARYKRKVRKSIRARSLHKCSYNQSCQIGYKVVKHLKRPLFQRIFKNNQERRRRAARFRLVEYPQVFRPFPLLSLMYGFILMPSLLLIWIAKQCGNRISGPRSKDFFCRIGLRCNR